MIKVLSSFVKFSFSQSKFFTRRNSYDSIQVLLQAKVTREQIQRQILTYENAQLLSKANAVWIFLNSINLQHVSLLVNQMGYRIHHGKNETVALYKWLSQKNDLVPPYSNFYISCGSIVIDNDHILLVQQSNGPQKGLFGIPGGRADVGQFIERTAERQLFQQTCIVARFQHPIYLRQMQNTAFGANDLYFVCLMKAQVESLKRIRICERQLSSYQWVHLSRLDQFVDRKARGTQRSVGNYICDLYKAGYNFQTQKRQDFSNLSNINYFTRAHDGVHRKYMEYKLINELQFNNLKRKDNLI